MKRVAGSQRWALSFADLCLLLLGFFVMLQARPDPARLSSGFRAAFAPRATATLEARATDLFVPNEAILSSTGSDRLAAFAAGHADATLTVSSRGTEAGTRRFDGWELAAARTAAVARALQANGIAQHRIGIAIDPATGGGQVIAVTRN